MKRCNECANLEKKVTDLEHLNWELNYKCGELREDLKAKNRLCYHLSLLNDNHIVERARSVGNVALARQVVQQMFDLIEEITKGDDDAS